MNSLVIGGILKRVYPNFNIDSFSNRLKLQKIIYLLQIYGINLGYSFSWYLHGPYSQDLTKDAYQIEDFSKIKEVGFEDQFIENKFKQFTDKLGDNKEDGFWLEIAASIHLLKKLYPNKSKELIIEDIKNKGVLFKDREKEIKKIWEEIEGWLI